MTNQTNQPSNTTNPAINTGGRQGNNAFWWKIGIGAVIVIILLILQLVFSGQSWSFFTWALIALVGLAVLGIIKPNNSAGQIAGSVLGIIAVLVLLVGIYDRFQYGDNHELVRTKIQDRNMLEAITDQTSRGGQIAKTSLSTKTPVWGDQTEPTIPVDVWSDTYRIGIGCSTYYEEGCGSEYDVRYRLGSGSWTLHSCNFNESPPANQIQFKVRKEGLTVVPFTIRCPL